MKVLTAAQIFMFTFVGYCVLFMDDSPQRFERGAQIFLQWTVVSAAKATIITDEMALEAKESLRAVNRALKPIGLDRHARAVRHRVISRTTLFKSYALDHLARDVTTQNCG